MIVDRGGTTAVSDLSTAHSLAGTAGPQRTIKQRGNPRASARGRRVTPPGQQTPTVVGRPGRVRSLASEGMRILRTPVRAPRTNAIAERWIATVRRELLDRILIINRRHLTAVLTDYTARFNHHRPHRALNQAAPLRSVPPPASPSQLHLRRRDLLDGLIHEYTQVA
jgi:putative transposase